MQLGSCLSGIRDRYKYGASQPARRLIRILLLLALVVPAHTVAFADVRLPQIFGDSMVLQRDQPIAIWGWADAGEKITVRFRSQRQTAVADNNGRWQVSLRPEKAGENYELSVSGRNRITLKGVMVGDIWICSGQSNMEMAVKHSLNAAEEIQQADYPAIRHYAVSRHISGTPLEDIKEGSGWKAATSGNVADFTAVGYFFARELYQKLKVPIGLLHSSWGGTMVETWISKKGFEQSDYFAPVVRNHPVPDIDSLVKSGVSVKPNSYRSLLYNAMIHPLIRLRVKGAIWYQGESNASRAYEYRKSFPLLITDWREQWQQGDLPFYFVQLASFKANGGDSQKGSTWAELREAQAMALALPNTGMAVTTDIGDTDDIHPRNKQDVGKRLAASALHFTYADTGVYSGPAFEVMKVQDNKATILFSQTGTGLMVKKNNKYGYIQGFEIAGADRKFYYARATRVGHRVVVEADEVPEPVAVRYAWADDAGEANLYNNEGFPAVPFRTDQWEGITVGKGYLK